MKNLVRIKSKEKKLFFNLSYRIYFKVKLMVMIFSLEVIKSSTFSKWVYQFVSFEINTLTMCLVLGFFFNFFFLFIRNDDTRDYYYEYVIDTVNKCIFMSRLDEYTKCLVTQPNEKYYLCIYAACINICSNKSRKKKLF